MLAASCLRWGATGLVHGQSRLPSAPRHIPCFSSQRVFSWRAAKWFDLFSVFLTCWVVLNETVRPGWLFFSFVSSSFFLSLFFIFTKVDMSETAYRLKIMSSVSMSILRCGVWLGYGASASLGTAGIAWDAVFLWRTASLCPSPSLLLCMGFPWLVLWLG